MMSQQIPPIHKKECCGCQCSNSPCPCGISEASLLALSQTLRDTTSAALMVAHSACGGTYSEESSPPRSWRLGDEDTTRLLQTLRTTAEAVKKVADISGTNNTEAVTTSVKSESEQLLKRLSNIPDLVKRAAGTVKPQTDAVILPPMQPAADRSVAGDHTFVLSQRVGTISLATWEGMSETRLKELDCVLKKIVPGVCDKGIGWQATGEIIHKELAAFGFRFVTPTYFGGNPGFGRAADQGMTYLARIQALSDHCKYALGNDWYPDEMIRVVQRLMELRGFET